MIYLLRHGLDDETYIGGWSDNDLTDKGKEQIICIAKFIKENITINSMYSSDIKRAVTTTSIIANELNIKPIYTSELRELDKGYLTGLKREIAVEKYPNYINVKDINIKYPNGESMYDLYLRISTLLEKIIKLDNSLLITHRGVINMIYFIINNRRPTMDKKLFNVEHASLHELNNSTKKIRRLT